LAAVSSKILFGYGLWWGVPLVLLLTTPWFVWANHETKGDLFRVFFLKHNLERGLGNGALTSHPWWFYIPRLMFDALPWTFVVPIICLLELKAWKKGSGVRGQGPEIRDQKSDVSGGWQLRTFDPLLRFGLIWIATMLVVLSCARFKRADYLLPAYPGLALFLCCLGERWLRSPILDLQYSISEARSSKLEVRTSKALVLSFVVASVLIGWFLRLGWIIPAQETRLELASFAREIRRLSPVPQLVLFFRTEAHDLAFHVGSPLDTILEWENLDIWASRPGTYYVVMPPDVAKEWPKYLKTGKLVEVLRNTDLSGGTHAHPLVLLRTEHPKG
jgi:4-amino-4-deoxy-L-arabinose transferase-like glycosyltransferase